MTKTASQDQLVSALVQAREALRSGQGVASAMAAIDAVLYVDDLPLVVSANYRLSPHFTLAEMTVSQTAARRGLDNTPPRDALLNLGYTARCMERVREKLGGVPILISSGYRSKQLNELIGGAAGSQHMAGEAVDFTAPKYGGPVEITTTLANSDIEYDQLILEFGRWVHISFTRHRTPRRQSLRIDTGGTRPLF